jgi:protein phosphatase
VADVVDTEPDPELQPLLVGAAADLPRKGLGGVTGRGLFRGHRSGDTGEIEPVPADLPSDMHVIPSDPIDREAQRYAPRPPARHTWLKRLLALAVLVGLVWVGLAAAWSWSQQQFYVGVSDSRVTIFRGLNAEIPGIDISHPYEVTDVDISNLSEIDAEQVAEGIEATDLDDARATVDNYAARQDVPTEDVG